MAVVVLVMRIDNMKQYETTLKLYVQLLCALIRESLGEVNARDNKSILYILHKIPDKPQQK